MNTVASVVRKESLSGMTTGCRHRVHRAALLLVLCLSQVGGVDVFPGALGDAGSVLKPKGSRNWTNFRGPGGIGVAVGETPPLSWNVDDGENLLWKTGVPSPGVSSPVIWGDRVYIVDYSGTVQIFKLGGQFERLGSADLGEDVFATPAYVNDRIYIRGIDHLFCVGK